MPGAGPRETQMKMGLVALALVLAIVVPFLIWGDATAAWIETWISDRRPHAWTVLAFTGLLAADVVLPIPSSVVAVAAGMRLGFLGAVATIAVGATLGCLAGWAIGRGVGRPGLRRFVGPDALASLDVLVQRYGAGALLLARAVPVLAEASVIVAGTGRFGLARTLVVTGAANVVMALVYAGAGELAIATAHPELALAAALGVPGIAIVVARWLPGRRLA